MQQQAAAQVPSPLNPLSTHGNAVPCHTFGDSCLSDPIIASSSICNCITVTTWCTSGANRRTAHAKTAATTNATCAAAATGTTATGAATYATATHASAAASAADAAATTDAAASTTNAAASEAGEP